MHGLPSGVDRNDADFGKCGKCEEEDNIQNSRGDFNAG